MDLLETADGGFLACGYGTSNNGDFSGAHGSHDLHIAHLSPSGVLQWTRTYGGSGMDLAHAIRPYPGSRAVVIATSTSGDGDPTHNNGDEDLWVLMLDYMGSILWQRVIGGSSTDAAFDLVIRADGSLRIAGASGSNDGDVIPGSGSQDAWVVDLDSVGNLIGQYKYGGSADDGIRTIHELPGGGWLYSGSTCSNDGMVTGNQGWSDTWVLHTNDQDSLLWQRCLGGSAIDGAARSILTNEGGLVVAAVSNSIDGDISQAWGGDDFWIFELDGSGSLLWDISLGGSAGDMPYDMLAVTDSTFLIAGHTLSTDGNVIGHHGDHDGWIVKIGPLVTGAMEQSRSSYRVWPNPASSFVLLDLGMEMKGTWDLRLLDAMGREIRDVNGVPTAGNGRIAIDVSTLPEASYLLQVSMVEGTYFTRLVVAR
ncbi:MAG: T9SS type A sorting domain-containing protein [Flavobacteriales bacterium]|nr:T9SS type A sorting domain-containing protein [Flavobacteriales bacterium]